jgi:hypothetical protein
MEYLFCSKQIMVRQKRRSFIVLETEYRVQLTAEILYSFWFIFFDKIIYWYVSSPFVCFSFVLFTLSYFNLLHMTLFVYIFFFLSLAGY